MRKCGRADEDDGINRRFVSRMQSRKPISQQPIPARDHRQSRAAGYVNAGRRDRARRSLTKFQSTAIGACDWEGTQPESQGLRHRTDEIDRVVAD